MQQPITIALRRFGLLCSICFCLALSAASTLAQDVRGSITGIVADPSGAAILGAKVTVTSTATGVVTTATTNGEGIYTVNFLNPGAYSLTVEAPSYKKLARDGVEVRVQDKLRIDLKLELGAVTETVNVTANASLLQTESGNLGQVIDRRQIADLPIADGNVFILAKLAPGMVDLNAPMGIRLFDNGSSLDIASNGAGRKTSEFYVDGVPSARLKNQVYYNPPAEMVDEFKIVTNSFDASFGHSNAATINLSTKAGGNQFHGAGYYWGRNEAFNANNFFANLNNQAKPRRRYHRYGGTFGGPLWLPEKIFGPASFDGRNRTFFFFSYEGLRDASPNPNYFTVPTLKQREGDFTDLPGTTIYDPLTARLVNGRVTRDPISCNGRVNVICPDRISPITKAYLQFYPLPNAVANAQGTNNFFSNQVGTSKFRTESFRLDHNISARHKGSVRVSHNFSDSLGGAWAGQLGGIYPVGGADQRRNYSALYDHVFTVSSSLIINAKTSFVAYNGLAFGASYGNFDAQKVGFPTSVTSILPFSNLLPNIRPAGWSAIGHDGPQKSGGQVGSVMVDVTKIAGKHSYRVGYDGRLYRDNTTPGGSGARIFIDPDYTKQTDNSATFQGQGGAAFLLGLVTGSTQLRDLGSRSVQSLFHGFYFQDDWKLTPKLTLNLGLRYEIETNPTERYNRIARQFDFSTPTNPQLEAFVNANLAKLTPVATPTNAATSRPPEVASVKLLGGYEFASADNRATGHADLDNIMPRFGFAYQVLSKTVVRGGYGIFYEPFALTGLNQPGYQQITNSVPSLNNGLTIRASLANPFPDGIVATPGNLLGAMTGFGTSIGPELYPEKWHNLRWHRFQFGVQHELPGNLLVEASYVGAISRDREVARSYNNIPRQYLSTSPIRDDAVINFLSTQFANPFRGGLTSPYFKDSSLLNNATLSRAQLLVPYPQFGGITIREFIGKGSYHSGQLRVEKRMSHGVLFNASYVFSKTIDQVSFLNATDPEPTKMIGEFDVPHRVTMSGIFELPFGRGRFIGKNWHRAVDAVLGGWQAGVVYQYQSGTPLNIGNIYFGGDLRDLHVNVGSIDRLNVFGYNFYDPAKGFYFGDAAVQTNGVLDNAKQRNDRRLQLSNNLRTLPQRVTWLRWQARSWPDLNIAKTFRFTESAYLQLRIEAFNAFNHPMFTEPNLTPTSATFGTLNRQFGNGRDMQLGLRLVF